jgi:TPR repeat protein
MLAHHVAISQYQKLWTENNNMINLTITEALEKLNSGEITSVELTRAYLNRIEQYGTDLNCYITVTPERAMADAAASDARRASGNALPLDGIPMAMKDLFATQYEQSVQKLEAGDYAEAIPALCDLAEKGYDRAQYMLGVCYREGMGVEKSMERAMIYIFDAAVQGLAEAQYEMGEMHGEKGGLLMCQQEAFLWYRAAARNGHIEAQYKAGNCYYNGVGVARNYDVAVELYRIAAEAGYAPAQVAMGHCYDLGEGVIANHKEAFAWYLKAAKQCDDGAMFVVGSRYEQGKGVERDIEAAREWYSRAARDGYEDAINALHDLEGLLV